MKKKIKSAVISIVVIAVLLLAILTGVKNGAIDKLTKEMPTHITIAPAQSSMKLSCDTHPFLNARPKPFVNVLYEIPDVKSDRFLLIIPLILAGFKLGINKKTTDSRTAARIT